MARRLLQAPEPDPARAEQLLTPLLDHPPDDSFRCFLMVALVIGELPRLAVRTEPILRQAIALDDLYLFAGLRPDATPAAAAARRVAALLALPAEQVARFCDRPKPPDWLERYRPFAEGRSRGASDPAGPRPVLPRRPTRRVVMASGVRPRRRFQRVIDNVKWLQHPIRVGFNGRTTAHGDRL